MEALANALFLKIILPKVLAFILTPHLILSYRLNQYLSLLLKTILNLRNLKSISVLSNIQNHRIVKKYE